MSELADDADLKSADCEVVWVRVPLLTPFSPVCCCTAAQLPAMGCSQVVRHGTLTPAFAGSSPATPACMTH